MKKTMQQVLHDNAEMGRRAYRTHLKELKRNEDKKNTKEAILYSVVIIGILVIYFIAMVNLNNTDYNNCIKSNTANVCEGGL